MKLSGLLNISRKIVLSNEFFRAMPNRPQHGQYCQEQKRSQTVSVKGRSSHAR